MIDVCLSDGAVFVGMTDHDPEHCPALRVLAMGNCPAVAQNSTLAKAHSRAGESSVRISDRSGFIPSSKGLRGSFITSHNIYYVKSNMRIRGRLHVCILLILCLVQ